MCAGGVHSILLLPLVARCLETIDIYIYMTHVFMSVVGFCGNVCCVVKDSVFSLGVLKYVVCLYKGYDAC